MSIIVAIILAIDFSIKSHLKYNGVVIPVDVDFGMEEGLKKLMGKRIKARRKAAQLSQEELGEQVNYSDSSICAFENGERSPSLLAAFNLADSLDCSVEDFRPEPFDY